ncbi:MAG: response regulator [Deltaproteobacteria bacterium]|nr:response regulator [Deltaproteobacteria bacterium]
MTTTRVLLVDDEVEFLEPIAARLARRGLECTSVTSGEQALAALAQAPYDCAIVDVRMPDMDGLELLRRMRRMWPQVSVILLTGHASIELGVKGMELGAFEYLLKPIEIDDLVDTVLRAARPR